MTHIAAYWKECVFGRRVPRGTPVSLDLPRSKSLWNGFHFTLRKLYCAQDRIFLPVYTTKGTETLELEGDEVCNAYTPTMPSTPRKNKKRNLHTTLATPASHHQPSPLQGNPTLCTLREFAIPKRGTYFPRDEDEKNGCTR